MDDALKIILTADLDDSSYKNITEKIEKIKNSVKEIKIKIIDEGNFVEQLSKLAQNIDMLNKKMEDLNKDTLKRLEKEQKKREEIAKLQAKQYEDAIKNNEKLKKMEADDLLKKETKYDAGGNVVGQTRVYGDDKYQTKMSFGSEGEVIGRKDLENTKKIRQEAERYKEVQDLISQLEIKRSAQKTQFMKLLAKANTEEGLTTKQRKELNDLTDTLLTKEKIRLQALEKQAEIDKKIQELKANKVDKGIIREYEEARKDLNKSNVIVASDKSEDTLKRYNQQLDSANKKIKEAIQHEKNYQKIVEKLPELRKREAELAGMGFDTKHIRKMIDENLKYTDTNKQVTASLKEIEKELNQVGQFDKKLQSLDDKAKNLGLSFQKTFKNLNASDDLNHFTKELENLQTKINQLKRQGNEESRKEIQNVQALINELKREAQQRKINNDIEAQRRKEDVRIRGDRVESIRDVPLEPERIDRVFDSSRSHLEREDEMRALAKAYLEQQRGIENVNDELIRLNHTYDSVHGTTTRLTYDHRDARGEITRYAVALDQATRSMYDMGVQQTRLVQQQTIWEQMSASMRRVPTYLATFGMTYEILELASEGFRSIYEIDEALTDLAKVTDATTEAVENFRIEASQMGQELGVTTAEVIRAVTEMQKLGYTFQESRALGETALKYANVGDMNVEDASNFLTSALAGFGVDEKNAVEESRRYADIFNEVGNNFAVTSSGIGEALKRSSAVLAEAGNNVEQSVAMIASANKVIQDEKRVGTAMKTISMRLRGVDEETGKLTGAVPELKKAFNDIGLELMKDATTFKSTYQIFEELAGVWDSLTDIQRAGLVEAIGGKHQGTVVSAMLGNWEDAQNALKTAETSMGSMDREFSKYQESLVYRVDELKASLEEFWLTFWDNDTMKGFISAITSAVQALTKFIDTFGSVGTLAGLLLPIAGIFKKDLFNAFRSNTTEAGRFNAQVVSMGTGLKRVGSMAKSAGLAIGTMLKMSVVGFLVGTAINGVVYALDELIETSDERIEKLKEEYDAQSKVLNQLDEFDIERYSQLENLDQAGYLTQGSKELEEYTELQKELLSFGNEFVAYYDEQGNAHLKSAETLKELNEQKREELRLTSEKIAQEQTDKAFGKAGIGKAFSWIGQSDYGEEILEGFNIGTPAQKLQGVVNEAEKAKERLKAIEKDVQGVNIIRDIIKDTDIAKFKEKNSALKAEIDNVKKSIKSMYDRGQISENLYTQATTALDVWTPEREGINEAVDRLVANINKGRDDLGRTIESFDEEIQTRIEELGIDFEQQFSDALSERNIDVESSAGQFAEILNEALFEAISKKQIDVSFLENYKDNVKEALSSIAGEGIKFDDLVNGSNLATSALQSLANQTGLNKDIAQLFNYFLANQSTLLADVGAKTATQTQEQSLANMVAMERNNIMAEYEKNAIILAQAIQTVNAGESLTISQVSQLTSMYPELSDAISTRNNVLTIEEEALQRVADKEEESAKVKLSAEEAKIKAQLETVNAFLKGAEVQVKTLQFLDSAYINASKTSAEIIGHQMAAADALAYQQNLIAQGISEKSVKSLDWGTYIAQRVKSYTVIARGQAKSAKQELERELANIQALKNIDLSANIQKTEAPLKKDAGGNKSQKETKEMVWITDEYKETMRRLNEEIAKNQNLMLDYPEYSKEYQKGLKEEARLINEKIKAIDKETASLDAQIASGRIQQTGLVEKGSEILGTGVTAKTLRVGSRGNEVKELQKALGISADGIFGKETERAVREFQKKVGIAVDGIVGRQTWSKLGINIANTLDAKGQQAIDQAKDERAQLLQERVSVRENYFKTLQELISSEVARLERESKKMEVDLVENEFLASKLDQQSKEFRYNREARLKLLQSQADANAQSIAYLNQELTNAELALNEKLTDEIYDMIDEQQKKYIEQQKEIYELQKSIAQSRVDQILNLYETGMEESDRRIADIERKMNDFSDNDLQKFTIAQQQIRREYEKQIRANEVYLKQLKAEENAVRNFPELYEAWKDSIAELTEKQKELNEAIEDSQREQLERHEEAIDELIDAMKDYYEEMEDLELEAIEKQMDALEDAYDKRIEMYEKDLEAFEKNIDEQLDKLDELEDKRQYEKELAEKQRTRQELIEQIGLLSLDTSQQGQQRKRQIEKELQDITEEIAETQRQKQLEERKKTLEDELKARQEETKQITESEEERYDKMMDSLEEHSKQVERKWENLIENERTFAKIREDLLAGNTATMMATIDQFQENVALNSELIGEAISQNIIDKFEQLQTGLYGIATSLTDQDIAFNRDYSSIAGRITGETINNMPIANPLIGFNPNNIPANTYNNTNTNQQININFNIEKMEGQAKEAENFVNEIIKGLERKGVKI